MHSSIASGVPGSPPAPGQRPWRVVAAFAAALLAVPVQAADRNLGRNMAAGCAACHGTDGISAGVIPSLAGQPASALEAALKEFRAGMRPATVMQQLAKGYSDEQIRAVAAYLAQGRDR